jgi:ureidoacrylate peracid hydrolase
MLPNPSKSALIVVDMQNGFCFEGGSCDRIGLPVARLAPAIEPCARLVHAARAAGVPIIYTRYVYRADFSDGGMLANELMPALRECRALVAGSDDAEIVGELTPHDGDYVLDKNRPSSFYATPLETWLNGLGVEELVICGVTTNCCVESTVRDASQRDYRTFVVADATAEFDQERHDVALRSMGMLFAHVTDVASVEQAWRKAA